MRMRNLSIIIIIYIMSGQLSAQTIALWLFDELPPLYPSHVLDDASENDYPLVIGSGGQLIKGRHGQALIARQRPEIQLPEGELLFGLKQLPAAEGRMVEPMSWMNENFCALMTSGENHLRKEVGFAQVTETDLNLGSDDWTVEFWLQPINEVNSRGCVFEIGQGPRGENDMITGLYLHADRDRFIFVNAPTAARIDLKTNKGLFTARQSNWHHLAFTYDATAKTLKHYADGQLIDIKENVEIESLKSGKEDYMSIGRDGEWKNPLGGALDELRFSKGVLYSGNFEPPQSFAPEKIARPELKSGPPLLFAENVKAGPLQLQDRKHLFIDDALLSKSEGVEFVVNPPKKAERVIDDIEGPFRKHLTVVEDQQGVIRIYNSIHDDFLAVRTSEDGVHFEVPDMGSTHRGQKNIVLHEMVGGLGNPFIDINGPDERRWKYISGYHRRGIYLYTSADGYQWTRHKTALLPFRSGTQSCTFYDDQRQLYVSYHRTGIFKTPAGATQRGSVVTETSDLFKPIPYQPLSQEEYWNMAKEMRLRDPLPWYLDNGPLTPGGFGLEFPHRFDPIDADPVGTDIYITKAQKYPWAPDTYLAFPIVYFHYEMDGPPTRQILMDPIRGRGSGPVETQLSVSRDGLNWQRFSRPTYVGVGIHQERQVYTAYIAHGMVRRGDEIWQYYFGENQYHSAWKKEKSGDAVYRLVQRLDGFVSMDAPYDREVTVISKPLVFKGNRLLLNIDTDAAGYAQVGFLDENGDPINGFSVDHCTYINGDFIETEAEWFINWQDFSAFDGKHIEEVGKISDKFKFTKDVSQLAGKTIQLVFRLRGCKLYSMQFVQK